MKNILLTIGLLFFSMTTYGKKTNWPALYNVTWNTPGKNSSESMPCGGNDIGLNIWVENGDILFYIANTGFVDENGTTLKAGRVRLQLAPNPFSADDLQFEQTLCLEDGSVIVKALSKIMNLDVNLRFWVEVNRPVIHYDLESNRPIRMKSVFESWRYTDLYLPQIVQDFPQEVFTQRGLCMMTRTGDPDSVFIYKDHFLPDKKTLFVYHPIRNDRDIFENAVRTQKLQPIKERLINPLKDYVFGTCMGGKEWRFSRVSEGSYCGTGFKGWEYETDKAYTHLQSKIICLAGQFENIEKWKTEIAELFDAKTPTHTQLWKTNQNWWKSFWDNSYIRITGKDATTTSRLKEYSQKYVLFRYMQAANLNGRYPTLFNGGLFTFDPVFTSLKNPVQPDYSGEYGYTPDYRYWGAGLTAQNMRLVYWPMLKNGDFELMKPQFDFYKKGLNNAVERTLHYWGHDGCSFTEQISILSLPGNGMYGFDNSLCFFVLRDTLAVTGLEAEEGIRRIWESQLEFSWMILQYHLYTGRDITEYLPFIEQSVIFYDEHYRQLQRERTGNDFDRNNKYVFAPANTLEKHTNARNPTSVIAGLTVVLKELIQLPDEWQSPVNKKRWNEMLSHLPSLPEGNHDGKRYLQPAENIPNNWHNHSPEMYPLYPYQLYGIGLPDLELMSETFTMIGLYQKKGPVRIARKDYPVESWSQQGIHAARLGDTVNSRILFERKMDASDYRFPAFFVSGDWMPDHNMAGTAQIHLQEMLLQTHDNKLFILPAWPAEWEVDFKLKAPYQTTVTCSYRDGKIHELKVEPASREKDIVLPLNIQNNQ